MFAATLRTLAASSAPTPRAVDVVVLGTGVVGAGVAYELLHHPRKPSVLCLEMEGNVGYHSTGRSAALFSPAYGGHESTRQLTKASCDFLFSPPADFTDPGSGAVPKLVSPRGVLWVAKKGKEEQAEEARKRLGAAVVTGLTNEQACGLVPVVRADFLGAALLEKNAQDMDVHALHQGYVRNVKRLGGTVLTSSRCHAVEPAGGNSPEWLVHHTSADGQAHTTRASVVVNCAGAWADDLAELAGVRPVGLLPKRRTVINFDEGSLGRDLVGVDWRRWPLVFAIDESFYFKPDASQFLASPGDQTPTAACDAQPDELDVAVCIHRLQAATHFNIARVAHKWAGLRCFVGDHRFVLGPDDARPSFVWAAGQGGYGIQTAPAANKLVAWLALGEGTPPELQEHGVDANDVSPARLATRARAVIEPRDEDALLASLEE